ncbi:hypothetical protein SAMN05660350_04958 [Geodermatophilus obscurus]|uniref:Uncharacterized protein n=1 Tax=Geodermatophilus obscurus TaxID=1861 RepID=A0A1M7V1A3_9ACTN|nr:hypothetical protein [Geodermatophilus obscurus]SHN88966.1 hypothetical protein SAMN05660350_04958 [Geodermatophilus obscurus]
MTDQIRIDRSSSLQLPMQAAPIDRSQLPASAMASEGGIEAAFGWGDVWDVVKTVGPAVLGAVSDRTLKRDIALVEWTR